MIKGRGIKLGIIGCGVMGSHHARVAASLPGVKLIGVADIDSSRAGALAADLNVLFFSDYHQLLPLIDAVIIASPTSTHLSLAKECLSARKHVLIEKPFTALPSSAEELIRLSQKLKLVLTAGMIERFNPAFSRLLKLLRGEKVHGLSFKRFSPFPERITDTNVIFDVMIHDLHLLQVLAPFDLINIKASGKIAQSDSLDEVSTTLTYSNGLIAQVAANRIFGVKTRNISVTTEKLFVDCDLLNQRIYLRDFASPTPSTIPVRSANQLALEQENFFDAIKGKASLVVRPEDALAALNLGKEIELLC